jgi:hypothetical protein
MRDGRSPSTHHCSHCCLHALAYCRLFHGRCTPPPHRPQVTPHVLERMLEEDVVLAEATAAALKDRALGKTTASDSRRNQVPSIALTNADGQNVLLVAAEVRGRMFLASSSSSVALSVHGSGPISSLVPHLCFVVLLSSVVRDTCCC